MKDDSVIVCAAMRHQETGRILVGVRHYCPLMRAQIEASEGVKHWKGKCDQGFVDQYGNFLDRKEAWVIAEKNGQIKREVAPKGTLYSENLY